MGPTPSSDAKDLPAVVAHGGVGPEPEKMRRKHGDFTSVEAV